MNDSYFVWLDDAWYFIPNERVISRKEVENIGLKTTDIVK